MVKCLKDQWFDLIRWMVEILKNFRRIRVEWADRATNVALYAWLVLQSQRAAMTWPSYTPGSSNPRSWWGLKFRSRWLPLRPYVKGSACNLQTFVRFSKAMPDFRQPQSQNLNILENGVAHRSSCKRNFRSVLKIGTDCPWIGHESDSCRKSKIWPSLLSKFPNLKRKLKISERHGCYLNSGLWQPCEWHEEAFLPVHICPEHDHERHKDADDQSDKEN